MRITMLIWTALAATLLSGLTLGLLPNGAPQWATQTVELATVVAVFVVVCLSEAAGSRSDKAGSH
jgi:membrane protein implicated in regulation of membrane protease activity